MALRDASKSLAEVLAELQDPVNPLRSATLPHLSGLDTAEAKRAQVALASAPFERRRAVLRRMVEMAEDNVDLDFTPIFRLSLEDEDEEVRESALWGLWECDERSLIGPLIRLLSQDPEVRVRAAAAQSLGRFAMLAQRGKLHPYDIRRTNEALLNALQGEEESVEVRRRALEATAPFDSEEVRELITEAYESENESMRASALHAMGRTGNIFWLPLVLEEMASPLAEIRYEAAGAAGEIGVEDAVPHLVRLLQDEDPEVQEAAIYALGVIGGSTAQRSLRRCLESQDPRIREAASAALGELESWEQFPSSMARSGVELTEEDTDL
ncbi:MAG: HEAT repeat domain-containing protein [Chloroflexi bacterium]|nr:HEAT repeat domain-containing protein [Chloroflexota bacterium]